MLQSRIKSFITYLKGKKILIITHHPADLDGFATSIALQFFFKNLFKNQEISLYFSEFSRFIKSFLNNFKKVFPNFNFKSLNNINVSNFDVIIIVDTNNLDQVKFFEVFKRLDSSIPFIFIDHHLNLNNEYKSNLKSLNIIFENYSSTAEIILEFFRGLKIKIPSPYKVLLATAILTDSGFFKYGNNQTIHNIAKLLKDDISFQKILTLLNSDLDISERIAKIKGLQRVELLRIEEWLLGITHVSSFSASVASMLISIGFDISIVCSEKKDQTIISTRAKKEVCLKTGLHLGKILSEIGEGSAGGHDGAASLNFNLDLDIVLKKVIDKIKKVLII
ncbi:MAG: DHH family phosphoesterase [Promethearchaeota archaeon]|jgi:nanoRNase/pAp phosphatase (c-di-AMP/oligoRNAs hydrolase)